jgi:threonyl-tRNA synthetase
MTSLTELRRSTAEVLACSILELFPGALLIEGKATEFGFYYDFIAEQPIDLHALPWIEEKMRGTMKGDLEVRSLEMMRENAASFFEHKQQPLIAERVREAKENIVSVYQIGSFYDYFPSKPLIELRQALAFKLLKVEKIHRFFEQEGDIPIFRVHGTVFPELGQLKKYIKTIEAGKRRDHRELGKELDLFSTHDEANPYGWFWHPRGEQIRQVLVDWWRNEHRNQGVQFVTTPPLIKTSLLKKAGLEGESSEELTCTINGIDYRMSPSLSITHAFYYGSRLHSYRELPIRYGECTYIPASSQEGVLWGMLNARMVYADRVHIFCTLEQIEEELISSLHFIDKTTKIFGFECHWHLKERGQKFAGTLNLWEKSLAYFNKAFEKCGLNYIKDNDDRPYKGPIAEAHLIDSLGRVWKGPSLAIDFDCPQRLGLRYHGSDDEMHVPSMITRSLFGSLERFIAVLIEHYAGCFPLWLAPEQVRLIVLKDASKGYAEKVCQAIEKGGYRTTVDSSREPLGGRIREAEKEKVPYIVIVGEKEEKQHLITVRSSMPDAALKETQVEAFLALLADEVSSKSLPKELYKR